MWAVNVARYAGDGHSSYPREHADCDVDSLSHIGLGGWEEA